MKYFLLLSLFLFGISNSYGLDEEYSPNVIALFQANAIVTCKVIPGENFKYEIEVLNVLKNNTPVKMETGTKLPMQGSMWSGLGNAGVQHAEAYVLYLRYYKKKWYTYTYQHDYPLKKGNIPFHICENTFYLNVRDFRLMRKQILTYFEYQNNCYVEPVMSLDEYEEDEKVLEPVMSLYDNYLRLCSFWQERDEVLPYVPTEPAADVISKDTVIHTFCEEMPEFVNGPTAFYQYIEANLPDSIRNNPQGIQGKAYVRFVVEPDSSITNISILRTVDTSFNPAIRHLIEQMPPMKPGKQYGRSVRVYYTVPIRIAPN